MFKNEKITVKCVATSKNTENLGGGGDTRMGVSMFFEWNTKNVALDMLSTKLRPSFYERAANDSQEDIEDFLPSPKFQQEKPFHFPFIGQGYKLLLHKELSFSKEYAIGDCKIEDFYILFKADGVVTIKWRTYAYPDEVDAGSLLALEKHDVVISLIPPASDYIAPEPVKKGKGKKAAQAANDGQGDLVTAAALGEMKEAVSDAPVDPMYIKAVASVRATKNPNTQALMTELRLSINDAARYIMRMQEEGIIRLEDDCYVVVEEEEKSDSAAA